MESHGIVNSLKSTNPVLNLPLRVVLQFFCPLLQLSALFNHVCYFQDESGSLSSGESDIGVDDDDEELLDDDDMDEGRGQGQDDGSQANSLNDSDNDF